MVSQIGALLFEKFWSPVWRTQIFKQFVGFTSYSTLQFPLWRLIFLSETVHLRLLLRMIIPLFLRRVADAQDFVLFQRSFIFERWPAFNEEIPSSYLSHTNEWASDLIFLSIVFITDKKGLNSSLKMQPVRHVDLDILSFWIEVFEEILKLENSNLCSFKCSLINFKTTKISLGRY